VPRPSTIPRYQRLYLQLRDAVLGGRLGAGARLPGSRTLAREMGVSRIVVLMAYEQLAAEGYISSRVGSGSRVALQSTPLLRVARKPPRELQAAEPVSVYARRIRKLGVGTDSTTPPAADGDVVDFRFTSCVPDARTLLLWRQAVSRAAASPQIEYPVAAGHGRLRHALSLSLGEQRGVHAGPDDILIVNGSQQGLDLITRVLCDRGVRVGIEDPHYRGVRNALLAAGLRIVPCPVDEHGLDIRKEANRLVGARAIWVTPSRQFPTGAVMSVERRLQLLEWSARNDVWVVEDDYDCEFHYGVGQIPALQGLGARGRVLYLGSFARTLFPGLRLGYLVVPPPLREHFRGAKWLADRGSSPLEQRALVDFIHSGAYESSRRRSARRLMEKSRLLREQLRRHFDEGELGLWGPAAGVHQFLQFPRLRGRDEQALLDHALRGGVRAFPGRPYHLAPPGSATLVLGYARVAERDIVRGVERLARAVRSFV
jgi:GntR family transcriptional regulator/MocR family aminotransferase